MGFRFFNRQRTETGFKENDNNMLLSKQLDANTRELTELFEQPLNDDFVNRAVNIKTLDKKARIFFINELVDPKVIEEFILSPLTSKQTDPQKEMKSTLKELLPIKEFKVATELSDCVKGINNGNTLLLIEGSEQGFLLDTTKLEHRNIDKPQSEVVIKGANEGFVESVSVNKSLIRKQLRYEKLVTEKVQLKTRANNTVSLMYVSDLVNEGVVEDVKSRLDRIEVDNIENIALLEQHLEERPYSLVPSILYTERPDRAVSYMLEGHVVLLTENSPACLVVPVTFWSFFHTAEDSYQRWAYANFIRFVRMFAFFIAIVTPSLYVAITNYHIEMLPTDLALAIAAKRETIPFPAIIEVLIMEASFELLREAGVRVPSPIGPTIGIVGALILGQAAVEANIVSPIMVIIIAITGLASFAIPDNSLGFMARIIRFGVLFLAAILGLFGIAIGIILGLAYLVSIRSFGVPFLSPAAPSNKSSGDLLVRRTIRNQWFRPKNIKPQDVKRKGGG